MMAATITGGEIVDPSKAKTGLRLLGGSEFIERTGATNLIGGTNEVQLTIAPCGPPRETIHSVPIHLEAERRTDADADSDEPLPYLDDDERSAALSARRTERRLGLCE